MTIVVRALALVLAGLAVVFAIANHGSVAVSLSPLPFVVEMPLYLLLLLALAVGAIIGGAGNWLSTGGGRRAARQTRQRAQALEREVGELRESRATVAREAD